MRGAAGSVYGRRTCAVMCCWDEDQPEWTPEDLRTYPVRVEDGKVLIEV